MNQFDPVIFTDKAKCEDCYRCLRNCPVKAIKIKDGQAFVEENRCILCGKCIEQCPQNAKTVRNDIDKMLDILNSKSNVAVSIAPSYLGIFKKWQVRRIASILRSMGFDYISETVAAAPQVSKKSIEINKKNNNKNMTTSCPVFVNYIEKYYPNLVDSLINVKSPMLLHGTYLRKKLGKDYKIIFIGPCIAKKKEAEKDKENNIDLVLTFDEINNYFEEKNIKFNNFEESDFDEKGSKNSIFYPLSGGALKAVDINPDLISNEYIYINGEKEISDIVKSDNISDYLIEPLFCNQGCIDGPGAFSFNETIYDRKLKIIELLNKDKSRKKYFDLKLDDSDFYKNFENCNVNNDNITEDQIREVLARTGKENKEDQLNCGACGYNSCREKAIAVVRGLAEDQMCIPYMRRLAEKKSDKILEKSPNGIVIMDEKLKILDFNKSFKDMFKCSSSNLGKHISTIIDPDPMEKVLVNNNLTVEKKVKYEKYNLVCYQMIYHLKDEKQIIGVFIDTTKEIENKERLNTIKSTAIKQAHELLEHQIEVAQKMTNYLGESTAKGEKLVKKLIEITKKENDRESDKLEEWL
ncbi:MAG TPA: [Fe-Fe] hydrogenase large subunit C-terminal domain-containing protein [Candidatus Mcinerneyibacterium sp.]|nr:[Fe-Fe] hydrogenase large subunit C-terminal domain-containing protein [Candidatus Mcinerneyibacterium sp.]